MERKTLIGLLLCSVALVGVVGAYAYLLNNQKMVGMKMVVNGYVLEVDKAVYKRGEPVRITFRNNGDQTVEFASAGWYIIRNSEGRQIAPGLVAEWVVPLSPGESLTAGWNQIDARSEEPVPPGIYTVELNPLSPSILKYLSLTFEIVD